MIITVFANLSAMDGISGGVGRQSSPLNLCDTNSIHLRFLLMSWTMIGLVWLGTGGEARVYLVRSRDAGPRSEQAERELSAQGGSGVRSVSADGACGDGGSPGGGVTRALKSRLGHCGASLRTRVFAEPRLQPTGNG